MYISTTSNIFMPIENKIISSKRNSAQTIPYFFSSVANEKKANGNTINKKTNTLKTKNDKINK